MNNSSIIVNGYAFYNNSDAALAETERKKVEYLKTHIRGAEPEKVLVVYSKAIEDRLFKTPVGIDFLREMQVYLIEQCDYSPEEVPPISVYTEFEKALHSDYSAKKPKVSAVKQEPKEKVPALYISVVLNILLVIAVIAMFVITLKSDNPNIINYETNLVNKYSYWEQELTTKQQELRNKENELKQREEAVGVLEEAQSMNESEYSN